MELKRYWTVEREIDAAEWLQVAVAYTRIRAALDVALAGPEGLGEPEVNLDLIALNGSAFDGAAQDAFILQRGGGHDVCRTDRLPYDAIVTGTLAAAARLAPGAVRIEEDLDPDAWEAAEDLCDALGLPQPRRVASSAEVAAKARRMPVRRVGPNRFTVRSGPWEYSVVADPQANPYHWACDCKWSGFNGAYCSHVQAVEAALRRVRRVNRPKVTQLRLAA